MIAFLFEVIGVSILVSLFTAWIGIIPKFPKRKYAVIQQLTNVVLFSIFITTLFSLEIYPSWLTLFLMLLLILWVSVKFTNNLVNKKEGNIKEHDGSTDGSNL